MTKTQFLILINSLGTGDKNTAQEVRNIFNAFADAAVLTGDIKEVDCDNTYLALNFDNTGLGINERVGWAICNGLNGTKDRNGRSSIGYGSAYTTVGATGGSKDAVLVAHTHGNKYQIKNASGTGSEHVLDNSGSSTLIQNTDSTGVSGTDKNYHPFIVSLFIQKL